MLACSVKLVQQSHLTAGLRQCCCIGGEQLARCKNCRNHAIRFDSSGPQWRTRLWLLNSYHNPQLKNEPHSDGLRPLMEQAHAPSWPVFMCSGPLAPFALLYPHRPKFSNSPLGSTYTIAPTNLIAHVLPYVGRWARWATTNWLLPTGGFLFSIDLPSFLSSASAQIPAGPAAMRLVHVDFFSVEGEVFHVASKGR